MITIQELLFNRGLKKTDKIMLVRHASSEKDFFNLYVNDKKAFLEEQNWQVKDIFKNTDYIISFIKEENCQARFVGVFKIIGSYKKSTNQYEMEEIPGFDDLKEKVIINWGKSARLWVQSIDNLKEVIEIHPGLHYKQFTDYADIQLSFKELKEIINNQYKDWKRVLSAVNAVYLIQDFKTGKLYVGCTYNLEGILGRWSVYVKTNGHCGNKKLKDLIDNDPNYANNFIFSILMLLPKTIIQDEAIKKERMFKQKLGTNAFGLNSN